MVSVTRNFTMGLMYLVSGIYSIGLSMALVGLVKPVSGNQAYVSVPDRLFPYEVAVFAIFGVAFLVASIYHLRLGARALDVDSVNT